MILFFGTRPGKSVTKGLVHTSCPHCHQVGTLTAVSQPLYFHLFWIPLFTLKTMRYVECSHCKKVFAEKEFTVEMQRTFE
ncbi:MAG: zinc-ribbon domain-containing protein [Bacteroidota bacterium]